MSKFLTSSAICMFAILLLGGIYAPEASFMWLANSEMYFTILRGVVIVMLVTLLITSPPRSSTFRVISGALSVMLLATVTTQLNAYALMPLDAFAFIQASIILGIAAIEPSPQPEKFTIFTAK